jgi:hypothetical protein
MLFANIDYLNSNFEVEHGFVGTEGAYITYLGAEEPARPQRFGVVGVSDMYFFSDARIRAFTESGKQPTPSWGREARRAFTRRCALPATALRSTGQLSLAETQRTLCRRRAVCLREHGAFPHPAYL